MFKFKGISSNDMQAVVEEEEEFIARAAHKYEQIDIDGRDGAEFNELGYSVVERPIYVQCLNVDKIDEILAWLDGEGEFEYKGRKTIARFYSELEPKRSSFIRIIDATFIRDPFWYKANEEYVLVKDDKIRNASGENINIEDSSSARCEVEICGNQEQDTREGYNLLDMSNAKGGTSGEITCTVNEDGSYSYVGTASTQTINVWLLGAYSSTTPIFTLEPGTYYINDVLLFENTGVLNENPSKKVWTFINSHKITGVRTPSAEINKVYNEIKYPIVAKSDKVLEWEQYGASPSMIFSSEVKSVNGSAKIVIENSNIMKISGLGTNWEYTDKGIKNTSTSNAKELTNFKIRAGQTIKIGFKLFSKPKTDTTFTLYVNKVSTIISSFGHIDRDAFELNKTYIRTYTAKEDCVISSNLFGNSNYDIFEFQMWAEYDNLTEYKRYEEQSYLVDVQQEMLDGDKFVRKENKWYEMHNWIKIIADGTNVKVTNTKDTGYVIQALLGTKKCKSGIGYSNRFIYDKGLTWKTPNTLIFTTIGVYLHFDRSLLGDLTINNENINAMLKKQYDSGNEIYVLGQLLEPQLIECTETQTKVLNEIYNKAHTYKNITNILAESVEVNPILNVKYLAKTDEKITNNGNFVSRPILRLEKTIYDDVDLTINNVRFKYHFKQDDYVEIDCEQKNVKYENLNRNRQLEIGYDFPKLNLKENNIIMYSGDCKIKVLRKDRWL